MKRCEENNEDPKTLPEITAHVLRHTACTRFIEAEMALDVVQKIMGHASIDTTLEIYDHVSENRKAKELEKLNNRVVGK